MRSKFLLFTILLALGCGNDTQPQKPPAENQVTANKEEYFKTIGDIPSPAGYRRLSADTASFLSWLRRLPLKKDKTVYLYDGTIKPNQSAQYAVVDIPRSDKDLMQCADVVMKMRAEYLFAAKNFSAISFIDYAGKAYNWNGRANHSQFEKYLDNVFGWCGSASLEKQLKPLQDIHQLQAGDVFVKGGFPGHAMIVADVAENEKGEKLFMLVQGYQPAQDIHVVINPSDNRLSPWYKLTDADTIKTPEWWFAKNQLRRW